jgi:hypothetical protein
MLRSGKARRTVFATADPPEQLVAKRSSAGLPDAHHQADPARNGGGRNVG